MVLKRIKIFRTEQLETEARMTDFIRRIKPADADGLTDDDYNEAKFLCTDAAELDTATQTAYAVKSEEREDGYKYKVSRFAKQMSVVVSLTK